MQTGKASSFAHFLFRTRLLLLLSSIFGICLCILLLMVGNKALFLWVNTHATPRLGIAATYFSLFGEWFAMVFLIVISLWEDRKKTIGICLSWLLGACFSWTFKIWIFSGLARPYAYFKTKNIDLQLVEGIDVHSFNTFPSGHTLTAFTSIFLFQFLFTGLKNWQIFLLFVLAMGCGLSRIILAQHWPQDVLGGLILGILAGLSGVFVFYKLFPQMERPSADIII